MKASTIIRPLFTWLPNTGDLRLGFQMPQPVERSPTYTRRELLRSSTQDRMQGAKLLVNDAAFGDDLINRCSTEGYLFTLFGGAIDQRSTKQTLVIKLSMEAEFTALSHAGTELIWWSRFFREIRMFLDDRQPIYCDNLQTIQLFTKDRLKLSIKLRHVDIRHHWLR